MAAAVALIYGVFAAIHDARAQQPADSPASVQRLAESGARSLALQRVDAAQPKQLDAPAWLEWERLRLDVLAARGADGELLERVRGYPPGVTALSGSLALVLHAARAALRSGEARDARRWLERVFAHTGTDALIADGAAYRAARQAVIDAYLAEGNTDAAYLSMLRFQQEFSPLYVDEVERFVAGLVATQRYGDAANWLVQLDPRSSYGAILRLRAGLLTADAAVTLARAALAKGPDPAALVLLEAAARQQSNRSLLVEAAELRLNGAPGKSSDRRRSVIALWQLYGEAAQHTANQAQLLVGDEPAWYARASRILSLQPPLGRALFGHLALKGDSPTLRSDAQLRLIVALKEGKLALVALNLFDEAGGLAVDGLDPRVRFALGELAVDVKRPDVALPYWRGLAPPSHMTLEQWQVRRLSVMIEAGSNDDALSLVRELLFSERAVTTESRKRLLEIALAALERFQIAPAEALLSGLRSRAQDAERFVVLNALARCHEAKGEPRQAAQAYLEAAMSVHAPDVDRDALRAREAAAVSLLKAGLREDARGVHDWLARHAKDAGVRESAARSLRTLYAAPRLSF